MRTYCKQFVSIMCITVSEAIRQSLCILLTGGTVLVVTLLPFLITHQFGEAGRLVRDSGLSLQLVTGLLLSVFLSSSVYRNEKQSGTMGIILCKPVSRDLFFLAKFAGIVIVLLLFSFCVTCSTLLASLASRTQYFIDWYAQLPLLTAFLLALISAGVVNYVRKKPFPSVALSMLAVFLGVAVITGLVLCRDREALHQVAAIIQAGILIAAAVLVLAGVAAVLVTWMGASAAVIGCGTLFAAGLVMDYLYGLYGNHSLLVRVLFFAVPNWQRFWVVDAISSEPGIPMPYFTGTLLYAVLYLAGILCGGLIVFRRVEVER